MFSSRAGRFSLLIGAIVLALKLAPSSALAETFEGDPPFALGRESCGQYLSDVANDQSLQALYDAWLSGYITIVDEQFAGAVAGAVAPVADGEMAGASAWVKNYCRQRADDSYLTAAVRLLAARERRQTAEATVA
jgi:hypothetical protein